MRHGPEDAGIRPESGEIVVTGASPVALAARRWLYCTNWGIRSPRSQAVKALHDYLRQLGASRILGRDEFAETRPLEKQIWAGAVDTVGNNVLAKVLAQIIFGGCVAACGLAERFCAANHRYALYPALTCACRVWIPS